MKVQSKSNNRSKKAESRKEPTTESRNKSTARSKIPRNSAKKFADALNRGVLMESKE